MEDLKTKIAFSISEIKSKLSEIDSIEANFYTISLLESYYFKKTDYETKMKEKKYGILFDKITVYANSSLNHGEVKINYNEN